MNPADRLIGWIESLITRWRDRLTSWVISVFFKGITDSLEDMTPDQKTSVNSIIDRLKDDPDTPDHLKSFLEQTKMRGNPLLIAAGVILGVMMLVGMLQGTFRPLGNILEYKEERLLHSFRFDPQSVITAWRRNPNAYTRYLGDLEDQGWDPERISCLKDISLIIPGVSDLIRMGIREAFDEEFAKTWRMDEDFYKMPVEWAKKQGLSEEWSKYYWRTHWELPASVQGFEMLRRGLITDKELDDLLRALDFMPGWRDKLIGISWEIPTRVDVRRFWDMRTIDEARLRELYAALGYHGKDLDDYVLWTKVYTAFPDFLAMYKNGWITLDQVKSQLVELGMNADRADEMIKTKIKAETPGRTAAERNLTKTDIIKGVKGSVITRAQGAEALMNIGYSEDEAIYILDVSIPVDEVTKTVTLRELSKSDIVAGLKAGIVSEEDARTRLIDLRYSPDDADFILKLYQASITPPAEPRLKEESKADILLGVKKGLITPENGYLLLLDIGFTPEASQFILMVHAETSPFSPKSFSEFMDLTAKYRAAAGMEVKSMPEELKKAGDEVVRLTRDVEALQRSITEEKRGLVSAAVLPESATARLTQLEVALHRAQAELERVQTEYNMRLAEWRHGA